MFESRGKLGLAVMAVSVVGLAMTMALKSASSAEKIKSFETAQAGGGKLRLEIKTACQNGDLTFKVKNAGTAWPKASTFAVYGIDRGNARIITERRMRLAQGQHASFRIKAKRNPTGRLGLAVRPGWYKRPAKLDATATCR